MEGSIEIEAHCERLQSLQFPKACRWRDRVGALVAAVGVTL
ncbi:hypothetical protein [Microcoleus sp. FACHB-1515]|nr:hypothetical protein [Microcoleus sp. FACHB-1515]